MTIPTEPPPDIRYRYHLRLGRALGDLWHSRELLVTLTEREVRARYKDAYFGFVWAAITPLLLMVVFTVFVARVADIDTGGAPYSLFTYVALVPWTFFSQAMAFGGPLLVVERDLIGKVAFPREVLSMSAVGVAGFHAALTLPALGLLFLVEGEVPAATSVWVPLLLAVQVAWMVGVVLALSSTLVYWRDLRQTIAPLLQIGLFATPVAYGTDAVPPSFLEVYTVLNPLVGLIDGYRRAVLFGEAPDPELLALSTLGAALALVGGYLLFKRLEGGFADVA